ncbi:unnamed protein product [Phytomonas sp. EM1]|nr:unnamed protein product [Phytomonas sp. EM1]|eukprot:CCW59753.1 unnamed protein product [Phytomonas sp. isolate EM1]
MEKKVVCPLVFSNSFERKYGENFPHAQWITEAGGFLPYSSPTFFSSQISLLSWNWSSSEEYTPADKVAELRCSATNHFNDMTLLFSCYV